MDRKQVYRVVGTTTVTKRVTALVFAEDEIEARTVALTIYTEGSRKMNALDEDDGIDIRKTRDVRSVERVTVCPKEWQDSQLWGDESFEACAPQRIHESLCAEHKFDRIPESEFGDYACRFCGATGYYMPIDDPSDGAPEWVYS